MQRYLYRVAYTHRDGSLAYEPICVRAETELVARVEVDAATQRYPRAVGATKTLTLVLTTADV